MTKSACGRCTTSPFPLFAPIFSFDAEKNDCTSGDISQSNEPSWMSPDSSIRKCRVCICICANPIDGDMPARVAAVKWIAACTTSVPMMTFSTNA